MKRILTTTTLAFIMMLAASLKNTASAQPRVDVDISYQTFYDELDPYGRWIQYPDYGYVWVPDAGPDFRPYETNGHWVWSDDYDWIWVSDYNWGWAPFHYGRWLDDPSYGWIWVPGYEWSPAWVAWRDGGDYYGWAPLRPGINISIGFSLGSYNPPVDYWCFAPRRYISSPRIYDYCSPRGNNITIINQTTIINNYNYNRNVYRTGPGRRDAERYAGRINPVRFRDASAPGRAGFRGNEVSVYRPRVDRGNNNNNFAPHKFERFNGNGNRSNNNGNAIRGNDNGGNRNNLPRGNRDFGRGDNNNNNGQRNGNDNGIADRRRNGFDRNNNDNNNRSTPGNNNDRPGRRNVFDRNNNDNRTSDDAGRERARPQERREIQQPPATNQNNNDRNAQRRGIFQRNENEIMQRRGMQQPQQQSQPRQFERRDMPGGRNNSPQEQQPRMQQPRMQQPQQQSQPRQFERRDNGGGGGNRGGDGGNHGGGRRNRYAGFENNLIGHFEILELGN